MAQVVPLRYDTAFKKAFSQPEIFCQFAEDVLGIKFHTDEVHRGYKFLEPIGQVDIEYDLFAEDPESRIVVEIQHVKERHFYDRFLYYHLINLVEQVKNSKAYQFDRTVYTIKDEESWEDTLIDVRQKEKEDIARALMSEGISTEVITRTTGLTEAEIEKLKQS